MDLNGLPFGLHCCPWKQYFLLAEQCLFASHAGQLCCNRPCFRGIPEFQFFSLHNCHRRVTHRTQLPPSWCGACLILETTPSNADFNHLPYLRILGRYIRFQYENQQHFVELSLPERRYKRPESGKRFCVCVQLKFLLLLRIKPGLLRCIISRWSGWSCPQKLPLVWGI